MKQQIRWTVNQAASEFQVGTKKLSSQLKSKGIEPGADGKFSTAAVVEALFDSERKERLRSLKEQGDHRALQNQETRRELVEVEALAHRMERPLYAMRTVVLASGLDERDRLDLLDNLKQLYASIFTGEIQSPKLREFIKAHGIELNAPVPDNKPE
jgi:hypothetical protein